MSLSSSVIATLIIVLIQKLGTIKAKLRVGIWLCIVNYVIIENPSINLSSIFCPVLGPSLLVNVSCSIIVLVCTYIIIKLHDF